MSKINHKILVVHGYAVDENRQIDARGQAVYDWVRKNCEHYDLILLPGGRDTMSLGENTLISDVMYEDLIKTGVPVEKMRTPRSIGLNKTYCPARDTVEEIGWIGLMLMKLDIPLNMPFEAIGFSLHVPRLELIYTACGCACTVHGTQEKSTPDKKTTILQRFATRLAQEDPFGEGKVFIENREKRTFSIDRTKQQVLLRKIWDK